MGFAFPESELRQQFESVEGRVGPTTASDWVMRAMGQGQAFRKDYSNITVPMLALLEFPRFPESYRPKDEQERALIEQFIERGRSIYGVGERIQPGDSKQHALSTRLARAAPTSPIRTPAAKTIVTREATASR